MAETADDLSTPLGQKTVRRQAPVPAAVYRNPGARRAARPVPGDVRGLRHLQRQSAGRRAGRRTSRCARRLPRTKSPPWQPAAAPAAKSASKPRRPNQKTITIIDGSSGARHDVVLGGDGADKADANAAPAMMAGIDQRLLEKSRYGMIPVVVGWAEALHGLRRRGRPRQGRQNARGRHRGRRPWRRRRQDHRRHHETAAGGDAGVYALRLRSRQTGRARARAAPRDPAAGSDGAVRLSRQRPRSADPAHHAERRAESRPAVLAPQPVPGLCRDRQFHGRALRRQPTP